MKTYKHLVFDIDGTLLDTADIHYTSLQEALEELRGEKPPFSEIQFSFGIPGMKTMEMLGFSDPQNALEVWLKYYTARIEEKGMIPFSGIVEVLLKVFEKGVSLGIITSKIREEYDMSFRDTELGSLISCSITASDTPKGKPDPAPMLAYMKETGAKPEEILYFGDTAYDMECAAAAGVDHALVLWGCQNPEGIEATYRLEKPEEILQFV